MSAVSADAGILVSTTPSCDGSQPVSQPFARWLDASQYTPLAGGDFESGSNGWTLSGGATIAAGSESYNVGGAGASSLSIPGGGSATSPATCVDLNHPTIRFFAKRDTGGLLGLSQMSVEVLFENNLGILTSLPIGVALPSSSWQPTLPMAMVANLLALTPGAGTPVQFRFTPLLGGRWSIDDVYVDPYQRR